MKKLINSIVFLIICFNQGLGQVNIVDSTTKKPIPYVYIISDKGVLLGFSDINGFIDTKKIEIEFGIKKTEIIEISHISYDNKKMNFETFVKNKILYLSQNTISLNEITIKAKKSSIDYLVLKGYFRSYQLDNSVPTAYMDGIVEYYIPLKRKTKALKCNIIENRNYRNPQLFNKKISNKGKKALLIGDNTGAPYIEKKTILNELSNYKLIDSTENFGKVLVNNDTIGRIRFDTPIEQIKIDIDLISPERSKTHTILNTSIKTENLSVSELYSSKTSKWNKKQNLLVRTNYIKQRVFSKKAKEDSIKEETFSEFYVLEKYYLAKSEFKKKNTFSYFGSRKTNYSTKFWENIEKLGVPKLPYFIDNQLGKTLEIY